MSLTVRRELTVGIVDRDALPVIEIVAPDGWYDYHAKYTKGVTDYRVPAPIPDAAAEEARTIGLRAFDVTDCSGFGRVDFRMAEDGTLYVLEVNTIPGFTETSLLPKAAAEAGMSFSALCDRIMRGASCGKP